MGIAQSVGLGFLDAVCLTREGVVGGNGVRFGQRRDRIDPQDLAVGIRLEVLREIQRTASTTSVSQSDVALPGAAVGLKSILPIL